MNAQVPSKPCTEVANCRGAGFPEHIEHHLRSTSTSELSRRILDHCGDRLSPTLSCPCSHYAREIGRRAVVLTYAEWCKARNVTHAHCPDAECEHPQPLVIDDGRLVCGAAYVAGQIVEMLECPREAAGLRCDYSVGA